MGVPIQARIFALFLAFLPSQAWAEGDPPVFILQWGSNGAGDGQFSGPHGIEVDAEGNVYVADTCAYQKPHPTGGFSRASAPSIRRHPTPIYKV